MRTSHSFASTARPCKLLWAGSCEDTEHHESRAPGSCFLFRVCHGGSRVSAFGSLPQEFAQPGRGSDGATLGICLQSPGAVGEQRGGGVFVHGLLTRDLVVLDLLSCALRRRALFSPQSLNSTGSRLANGKRRQRRCVSPLGPRVSSRTKYSDVIPSNRTMKSGSSTPRKRSENGSDSLNCSSKR